MIKNNCWENEAFLIKNDVFKSLKFVNGRKNIYWMSSLFQGRFELGTGRGSEQSQTHKHANLLKVSSQGGDASRVEENNGALKRKMIHVYMFFIIFQ